MKDGPVKDILIVGGGTAGWMSALWLHRHLRRLGCSVTLVESESIGTIGVGEATIPSIVQFNTLLGIDEAEFMQNTSATYKLAIRFDEWLRPGHSYWHPFGLCGGERINGLDLFHFWLKRRQAGRENFHYSDYSLNAGLAQDNKRPAPAILREASYAYHLDAGAFADYLRRLATSEGVCHLVGDVGPVALDDAGDIASVTLTDGRCLAADLFIDASGFSGLLIEKALGDPWIDWSDQLLCDSACALPLPVDQTLPPFTRATALPAGWSWRIPLTNRTGTGYVYSSAHVSHDAAAQALLDHTGASPGDATPRRLSLRVGRRTAFWRRNCVAVGLASGFVEPLESTGIHLIQHALMALLENFPTRRMSEVLRTHFNRRLANTYDDIRDFILLHYLLTERREDFWRDARSVALPHSLQEMLALYDENGRFEPRVGHLFPAQSYYFILTGCERLPNRCIPHADAANVGETGRLLDRIRAANATAIAAQPAHRAALAGLRMRMA